MKARYEQESGFEIDEASDIAVRLKVLAGEIYNMETTLDWTKRQMFASTATGENLDKLAAQRGITRKAAVKATGQLTFRLAQTLDYAVSIPRGTVVATDDEIPVRFVTTADGEIPQATYSVDINAEAELAGYRGNINAHAATVPVSVPAAISSVSNNSRFTGGSDEENDIALRGRILASYTAVPNGLNADYYINLALTVNGVERAGVVERNDGYGTAAVYVCGMRELVSDAVLGQVNALLSQNDCVGAMVTAQHALPRNVDLEVTVKRKAGYTAEDVRVAVGSAFADYVYSIPMGSRFYLSALGKYLLDTGCIENYEYDLSMQDLGSTPAMCFVPGDMTIGVTS
ncbi:baseplate J/gp47 family protein [Ruminococcus sp.]|uniref:baseplate J/gp47 family protein n=1 Tax=Ruminococcus sp. TaxID=41978 RepID=UPI002E7A4F86|nr:baseplate J/gp47 family protein [Ruminococcus sp.]MEE1264095.1 baseplate J/gp47 family protein [Ruminococcus sp.]